MSRSLGICAVVGILALAAAGGGASADSPSTQIAYIGKIPELRQPALYLANSDGSDRRLITPRGHVARHSTFSWSPDGQQIAFTGWVGRNEDAIEIFLVNADGTGLEQLTHSSGKRKRTPFDWSANPSWSPDGKLIAFDGSRDEIGGGAQIFLIRSDGTGQRRLTPPTMIAVFPTWSPVGGTILFERDLGKFGPADAQGVQPWVPDPAGRVDLYTMTARGAARQKIAQVRTEFNHCTCPAWSPDGTKIVYEAAQAKGKPDVYVMNADGTGRIQLTTHPARDENPDWSPDGTQIAFYSERPGNAQIYVMNADGTQQQRITHDPWYDQAVRWRPAS